MDSFYWTCRNLSFPICFQWGPSKLGTETLQQLSVSPSASGLEAESHHGPFMLKFLVGSLVFMLYYGFPPNFDLHSWEPHLHSAASASLALIFHNRVPYLSKCDSSPNPHPLPNGDAGASPTVRKTDELNWLSCSSPYSKYLVSSVTTAWGLQLEAFSSWSRLPKSRASEGCFSESFHG